MRRDPYNSSTIFSAGYDPATRVLEIEFRNHRLYRYLDVPPEVYAGLRAGGLGGGVLHGPDPQRLRVLAAGEHRPRQAPPPGLTGAAYNERPPRDDPRGPLWWSGGSGARPGPPRAMRLVPYRVRVVGGVER